MAQCKLTSLMDSRNQVLCSPDTELKEIYLESYRLMDFDANICKLVQRDLDNAAMAMKKSRAADACDLLSATSALPGFKAVTGDDIRQFDVDRFELETGRPRLLDGEAVFLLAMSRAHLDSVTSKTALDRLFDSMLVDAYFEGRGMRKPSRSVLNFWVNKISKTTWDYIIDAQLRMVFGEGLDNMESATADSFSVWADTAWPTDSAMIHGLLRRTWHVASNLPKFGLSTFTQGYIETWLKRLRNFDRQISFACGKSNSKRKIRRLYGMIFRQAESLVNRLDSQTEGLLAVWNHELGGFSSKVRSRLEEKIGGMLDDLNDAARVVAYSRERVFEEKSVPMCEKVLSLSDGSAAYIKKGQREAVIGYKPQVVRSREGFVTAFEIMKGNPSDASRLTALTAQHIERTGIVPTSVSVDDGYSSRPNRDELLAMGVETISMKGATGRKVTPEEDWISPLYEQARNDRSAVESLVFTLRCKFHLHRFSRRGLENVEIEMYEKIVAHNLWRAVLLRKRAAVQMKPGAPKAA